MFNSTLNRRIAGVLLLSVLGTTDVGALDDYEARHLWGRVGFGISTELVENTPPLTREQAVNKLLNRSLSPAEELNFDLDSYVRLGDKNLPEPEKTKLKMALLPNDKITVQLWWYKQILSTQNPLQEKMTIFWHNHFTSDLIKVLPPLLYQQNQIFRQYGLENFRLLLYKVMQDPAIHLYLDNQKNHKNKPNENLARELLELFTMGEGDHYNEEDIRQIAKALTGYRLDNHSGKLIFKQQSHDS